MEERKLTEKEKKRLEIFNALCKEKDAEGYKRKDLIATSLQANELGTLYAFLLCIPFGVLFFIVHRGINVPDWVGTFWAYIILIVVLFSAIIIHELLHGITWSINAKSHWKSIDFGVVWKSFNPYCTCIEPLSRRAYILGSMMPGFVLGIIPSIVSLFTGDFILLVFGIMMILCAGGDLFILIMILKSKANDTALFLDHPTQIGLIYFEK